MKTVTILGAGAMGSALTTPLVRNGASVRLWGTRFDDDIIAALTAGEPHPGTRVAVAPETRLFSHDQLDEALADTELVIIAVTSTGIFDVASTIRAQVKQTPLAFVTKGFYEREDGTIALMPSAIRTALGAPDRPIVAIGGPCKANEVASGRVTASVYASRSVNEAKAVAEVIATSSYIVETTHDEVGVEICAPLKNVYAIALGFADGLHTKTGEPWHNFKSALFAQAVREMATVSKVSGGDERTAFGLAGLGDLEVTGLSGRNKVFGTKLGEGQSPEAAKAEMDREHLTVEGLYAAELGMKYAQQRGLHDYEVPLLCAVHAVLKGADPLTKLTKAIGG